MKKSKLLLALFLALLLASLLAAVPAAWAGQLKKDYFAATKQGSWAVYQLETPDGTKATSSSQREADQNGQVVVEESMKIKAGAGAGTETKNIHVLSKNFNLAHDWLSFGKFTEKMKMKAGGYEMPVDANTLAMIKQGSKDFRDAVTFEGVEVIDGRSCDRYAYSMVLGGPSPSKETGKIWLDPSVPFGIVRHEAKVFNLDGSPSSAFSIKLQETGQVQLATAAPAVPAKPSAPAAPAVASLLDAYKAGRVGLEVSAEAGSNGRQLRLVLINKTDDGLTVKLAAGPLDIPASSPVDVLKISIDKALQVEVPAGDVSAPITVGQRAGRGVLEGKFELSVYEGTQLFSGSVTKGTVAGK